MDYEKFLNQFQEDLKRNLPEKFTDAEIKVIDVEKLQGESYKGLNIRAEGSNVAASMNMKNYFDQYEDGRGYTDILRDVTKQVISALDHKPEINISELSDYEAMKQKLSVELVPTKGNEEMLESVPHKDVEDMAMVCRFTLESSDQGKASILIRDSMLKNYGITPDQLFKDAMEYAPKNQPAVLKSMAEVLGEMMGEPQENFMGLGPEEIPMYVASVPDNNLGAGVIMYPGFLDEAAEKIGGDFHILPSSLHEVILVPDDGDAKAAVLADMVQEVNATQVSPEDQLSDHVYHYDSREKVFEMTEKFEKRMAEKATIEKDKGSILKDLGEKKKEVAEMLPKAKQEAFHLRGEAAL